MKINVKKIFGYIAAFFVSIATVICAVLYNRKRNDRIREHIDNARAANNEIGERINSVEKRIDRSTELSNDIREGNRRAQQILQDIKSRKDYKHSIDF